MKLSRRLARCGPRAIAVAGLLLASNCGALATEVTAIQKVVSMLQDLLVSSQKEKNEEAVAFSAFSQWCDGQKSQLVAQVKRGKNEIESLSAESTVVQSHTQQLIADISELHQDVEKHGADIKAHVGQREEERAEYRSKHQDYSESLDALERAISVLSRRDYDRPSMLQVAERKQLPETARSMISAFLGMGDGDEQTPLGQPHAYESKLSGVIEMLGRLRDEFDQKKTECEKGEMNSQHANNMIVQDLTDSVENAKDSMAEKGLKKAAKDERAAGLAKDHDSVSHVLAQDEVTLGSVNVECREKTLSFTEKQRLRTEEIGAISTAIEILSRDAVQGPAAQHLSLAAAGARVARSLVQVLRGAGHAKATDVKGLRSDVRRFIEEEGQRLHSNKLGLLAEKIQSDPFAKVQKLIESLIMRLLQEAKTDTEHEGFCNKELGVNKITRTKLSQTMDSLTAAVEGGKASISQLGMDITALTKDLAELEKSVSEATSLRQEESKASQQTLKEAEEAAQALQSAMVVLREFYTKASSATAFVQTVTAMPTTDWGVSGGVEMGSEEWKAMANPDFKGKVDLGHKSGMQTFGSTYVGKQDEAGGVLAMLEVILSDFLTLKADTQASEIVSTNAFNEFIAQSTKQKAVKNQKWQLNSNERTSTESRLNEDTADFKYAEKKMLAADRSYKALVPQCMDQGMTFEGRTQARAQEIQSLKEALRILEGESVA